ncbi:MAG: hypothetical protein NTV25_07560 [Methanothrix sp.]|nr:hypothetical protein [Methanothrix sp.]
MRLAIDPKVKKALRLASRLEVLKKVPDAVELEDITIGWQDGLPQDEVEVAQVKQLEAKAIEENGVFEG